MVARLGDGPPRGLIQVAITNLERQLAASDLTAAGLEAGPIELVTPDDDTASLRCELRRDGAVAHVIDVPVLAGNRPAAPMREIAAAFTAAIAAAVSTMVIRYGRRSSAEKSPTPDSTRGAG